MVIVDAHFEPHGLASRLDAANEAGAGEVTQRVVDGLQGGPGSAAIDIREDRIGTGVRVLPKSVEHRQTRARNPKSRCADHRFDRLRAGDPPRIHHALDAIAFLISSKGARGDGDHPPVHSRAVPAWNSVRSPVSPARTARRPTTSM